MLTKYVKTENKNDELEYDDKGILKATGHIFKDLVSEKQQKPLFIMFSGEMCPYCDEMEVYFNKLAVEMPQY